MEKTLVMVLGVVFVIIGLLGFVNNPVLGIFEVDMWHNLVHLLSGILALVFASQGVEAAQNYAKVFGIVYAVVTVWGFVTGDILFGLIAVNGADNVLHLVLAVVLLWLGFKTPSVPAMATM